VKKLLIITFLIFCTISTYANGKFIKVFYDEWLNTQSPKCDIVENPSLIQESIPLLLNNSQKTSLQLQADPFDGEGNKGCFCVQINLFNEKNHKIWSSPIKRDCWLIYHHGGVDFLDIIGDIDQDNKTEMVIQQSRTDVGPMHYNIYEWNNKEFILKEKIITLFYNKDTNYFEWKHVLMGKDGKHFDEDFYEKNRFSMQLKPVEEIKSKYMPGLNYIETSRLRIISYSIYENTFYEHLVELEGDKFKVLETKENVNW